MQYKPQNMYGVIKLNIIFNVSYGIITYSR